ncbi:MAG TPA: TetR/AcrR family transcriptional regulator [Defluviitoga sp.]|nr:TetR/AcrR family transcriptional regulator [Defluviitoga sp.]HOP24300.1 TetR/AcrR family transcriptional regulator [Defluviitoga sp.]HPZ28108.1 TetR/AcrR family transcriptional regulator [Defluviitoga sp.]HQD61998.1 TetR/AcrR family transcriptional regulator [Defluviitoga sp.]
MANTMKTLDKIEKKKYIAEKTLELISKKGLANFTMEDVAVACNVSKGSLYNYFKNKNALIIAAFSALMEKMLSFFEEKISEPESDSLEKSAEIYTQIYSEILSSFPSGDLLRLLEILLNSTHDPSMMQTLTKTFKEYYNKILSNFEKIFKSKSSALMLQAMFDGLVIYKAFGVEISDEEIEENVRKIVLCLAK